MGRVLETVLGLALVVTLVSAGDKFAASHSAILEKFHPIVKQFSSALADNLDKSSPSLQVEVFNTISQTLASQVDEFVAKANSSNGICCQCASCTRPCRACGRSCCCAGSGGCTCRTCEKNGDLTGNPELSLESVEPGTSPSSLQMWSAVTKDVLIRHVRAVVAAHSPASNDKCCACTHCSQYTIGVCGFPVCCESGKICVCKKCARTDIIQLASMDRFVSLTPEAENQVQQVSSLVDELVILISVL